jgi:hypothetical protein
MTQLITTLRPAGLAIAAFGALAACGGGGAAAIEPASFAAFGDLTSQQTSALAAASLDTRARSTSALTGSLNRAANTASIGTLTGAINADRSAITLTSGGNVTLAQSGQTFSARFVATPVTGNRTQGVLGAVTPTADLPTGSATFNGPTTVTIQDGATVYDLTGDAEIAANFATNRVTTTLSGLDGAQSNGISATVDVTDVATVTITGSTIAAATFSGGTVGVDSTTLSALGATAATSINGTFFGPTGQEVGGVVSIDDTATGNLRVFGDFVGR